MDDVRKLCDRIAGLAEALRDSDPVAQRDAARAIGDVGEVVARAIPDLIRCLGADNDVARVRSRAAAALRKISLADTSGAVPILTRLLKDADPHTRCDAAWALARIRGSARPSPYVVECARDADPNVRFHAALALGDIGEVSDSVTEALTHMLGDEDDYVRVCAARSLATLGHSALAMQALNDLLNHEDAVIREAAAAALPILRGEGS
jgi:HEAT repeat protein